MSEVPDQGRDYFRGRFPLTNDLHLNAVRWEVGEGDLSSSRRVNIQGDIHWRGKI